jgi:hypothetical protein
MKQKEEAMGFADMYEGLKELITSKNDKEQANNSLLVEIAKRLSALEKGIKPLDDEQHAKIEKSRQEFNEAFLAIAHVAKSNDKKLTGMANNQLRLVRIWHKLLKPKCSNVIWRLIYRICHKPFNSMAAFFVEVIIIIAFFVGILAWSQNHWKDVAIQNEENAMKYRFIRSKGWATSNMIYWLDSVYVVHSDNDIENVELHVKDFELLRKKHYDSEIRKSQQKKQSMR